MVSPTESSLADLKRLGRYLKKYPNFAQVFATQAEPTSIKVQVDSDHAGDAVTRRSTTGMIALYGTHTLKHASNVQSTIALSTGESEYYALYSAWRFDSVGTAVITIRFGNQSASDGRVRFQFGKGNGKQDRPWKGSAHPNALPMAAGACIHGTLEGAACTGKTESCRRFHKECSWCSNAQDDGEISIYMLDGT